MVSPALSTFLLALSTQVLANNNSPVAPSSYSASTSYATPVTSTWAYPSGTFSADVPIYSCVYYVNATSTTGALVSATSGVPHYNASSSYYPIDNATYSSTSWTSRAPTYTSYGSAFPNVSTIYATPTTVSYSTSYAVPSSIGHSISYAVPSSVSYWFRPLTSTIYATLYTTDGAVSTVYATPTSVLIGYPTGLPICDPYNGGGQGTSSSTSSAASQTNGTALQANDKSNENIPSTGFTIRQNVAGITLGAVAGVALVML